MGVVCLGQCSCSYICRLNNNTIMAGFIKVCLVLLVATSAFGQKAGRSGKNLRGTFPFNSKAQETAHHGAHHHEHNAVDEARASRQRGRGGNDDVALDIGSIAAAGERCIDKVVMEQTIEYDDVITCKHSYDEKCHTTYTTDFEPQQEEECEETFTKSCFIEYKKSASEETIQFCYTPLICEGKSDTPECKTVYESHCTTTYHPHAVEDDVVNCPETFEEKCIPVTQGYTTENKCSKWPVTRCKPVQRVPVTKHTPHTQCEKKPRELCGDGKCIPTPGPEQCHDKKETVVTEVPEETCTLEPQKTCKFVTKLVPLLKPVEECVDIPKEVCSRSRGNPRPVKKPVVKRWCYVPSEESGLA